MGHFESIAPLPASEPVSAPGSVSPSGSNDAAAFLGVERSFSDRRWRARPADPRAVAVIARDIAEEVGAADAEVVAAIMASRGATPDTAAGWLSPSLRAMMPDPASLMDMDRAADRLARAVRAGEAIAIFGDYDVDGATSAALLTRWLRGLGIAPRIYVPDRLAEGYGPNAPALHL